MSKKNKKKKGSKVKEILPKHIKDLQARKITPSTKFKKVKPMLSTVTELRNGKKAERVVLGFKDALLIYGAEGCRKSYSKDIFLTSFYKKKNAFKLKSHIKNPVILDIDTEQSEEDTQLFRSRFYEMCGYEAKDGIPGYHAYNLKPYAPRERMEMISTLLAEIKPDILVVDQVADLCYGYNHNDSVQELQLAMDKWMSKYKCSLILLMHSNREGKKSKGILGARMDKKCATSWLLTQRSPDSPTIVRPQKTRKGYYRGWEFDQKKKGAKFLGYLAYNENGFKKKRRKTEKFY